MATHVRNGEWLLWIADLVRAGSRQAYAATLPPDRFHCLLDELPLHLIPPRALNSSGWWHAPAGQLFLNPQCLVLPSGRVPEELQQNPGLLDGLAIQNGVVAWVRDHPFGSFLPFWLGPRLQQAVANLRAGEPAPEWLPEQDRLLLAASGILTPQDYAERRLQEWDEMVRECGVVFRTNSYVPLGGLIHPFHLGALRRYYRHQIRNGNIRLGDHQSPRRYVAHNEPVARFFHRQIVPVVSAIAGKTVKPSYVYMASYLSGAQLKKHTDRVQCEFSVTLCLDFSPEPLQATSWPICLDSPAGRVKVYQALGDALVYRGTKLPHYRNVLPEGNTSTSIFFHYVPDDFTGTLD
jgi:hypothetical protein